MDELEQGWSSWAGLLASVWTTLLRESRERRDGHGERRRESGQRPGSGEEDAPAHGRTVAVEDRERSLPPPESGGAGGVSPVGLPAW